MATDIVSAHSRPRAIAKEKDGIVLYWVEELGIAGIHQTGLAKLFSISEPTASRIIAKMSSGNDDFVLEAEIVTVQGVRMVTMLCEKGFSRFARYVCESKVASESKEIAWQIIDRFSAAGLKLFVMLELAPHQLKAQVDQVFARLIGVVPQGRPKARSNLIFHTHFCRS